MSIRHLIVISGDGSGAGKTTLARRLSPVIHSFAAELRLELAKSMPTYDWYAKDQAYKDGHTVAEYDGLTVRQVMVKFGQSRCVGDEAYWARRLLASLAHEPFPTVAVDDLRKTCELDALRSVYGGRLTHFHVQFPGAVHEPQYENHLLAARADYLIIREPQVYGELADTVRAQLGIYG